MTSGPVYVGAFIITLFIMGLFLVKGPVKNALVIATLLSILLAWGKNFMPFTDFFLEYVPMYNKFRAVSSMLVVAEFTIPLLAILCIKKIYDHPEILKEKQKWVLASIGITGGLCLLIALLPEWFIPSFTSENDQQIVAAIMQQVEGGNASQVGNSLINNLTEMRIPFVTGDAWRSFFIIVIGSAMLLSIRYFKVKPQWAVVAITLLCLFDMGKVNKRYLNDQHFVAPRNVTQTLTPSEADKIILQDKDPNFRVLNFTTSTFNDPITSYFHKSVGGYHAAKLRRYQDLIENYISPEMNNFIQSMVKSGKTIESLDEEQFKIINMLNTKYFIVGGKQGNKIPITNPYAYGNAWFVNNIHYTDTPDQEIASLQTQNLRETAVIDKQFAPAIKQKQYTSDSLAYIKLTQYQPNKLVYESQASTPQLAVFSEIFYQDGWKAYVDGGEIPIVRANYLLRATEIPAGKHSIEFRFDPLSIHITESIAYGAIVLLLISILAFFAYNLRKKEARN